MKQEILTLMVVGENPDELLKKYDMSLQVEPYIKYKFLDAKKIKKNAEKMLTNFLKSDSSVKLSESVKKYFEEKLSDTKDMTDFEYYQKISDGLIYDSNGNAISTENPNGRWKTYRIGRNLCIPLELKNGEKSLQARAGDINWNAMHMANKETYEIVWDMVHNIVEPKGDEQCKIYNAMKDKTKYFENFKDKEDYVCYSSSYWNYAFLSENGWKDMDDSSSKEWINNYFNNFIKTLKDDDLVTIYEFTK